MTGHDDHWVADPALLERFLHLQAVHFRHPNVEQDATGWKILTLLQKFDSGGVGTNFVARRLEHEAGRAANGLVIVDQMDNPIAHAWASSLSASITVK
jgi:hypothetical protein